MFIKDHRLYYDYNFLDGVHYHLTSGPLPKGETVLTFDFERTGPFAGTGRILVNGEEVDRTEMPRMHLATYSLAETFDVGLDTGTQVDPAYEGSPFPFTGALDKVIITLTDQTDTARDESVEFIDWCASARSIRTSADIPPFVPSM